MICRVFVRFFLGLPFLQSKAETRVANIGDGNDGTGAGLSAPVLLTSGHDATDFSCGKPMLDDFLKKFALQNQSSGSTRTYVAARGQKIVGYYSLAPASIQYDEATERSVKGLAKHPVPAILMARYAVTQEEQGKGLGTSLFRDALLRAYNGAQAIGGRIFLVHAKDEEAALRYEKWGMERLPKNSLHLCFLFKDVKKTLGL